MRWLRRLLAPARATAPPPVDWPPSADRLPADPLAGVTWQVGDHAECIIDSPWFDPRLGWHRNGPRHGEVRVVASVVTGVVGGTAAQGVGLGFARYPFHYNAAGFRKVLPRADAATRAEPAFAELLARPEIPAPTIPAPEGAEP